MNHLGLYAALATTAGIFVGLLNAYIVSRITGMKAERRRIKQRVKTIDARLESLSDHQDWRETQISEQVERRERNQAREDVEDFIDEVVGSEWSPSPGEYDLDDLLTRLSGYLGVDKQEISNYHIEAVKDNIGDIEEKLRPHQSSGLFGMPEVPTEALTDPSASATYDHIETQWEIYDRTLLDRRSADLASVETEIEGLIEERERLSQQYIEADPTELSNSVKATGWAIVLSVGVPLFTYLSETLYLEVAYPWWNYTEPILVFMSWSLGLGLTYIYMRNQIKDTESNLPPHSLE